MTLRRPVRLIVNALADEDLETTADYLAERNLDAALRFLAAATDTFESLAAQPGLGRLRDAADLLLANIRQFPVRGFPNYLVLYRVADQTLEVLRVLHGARNVDALLALPRN